MGFTDNRDVIKCIQPIIIKLNLKLSLKVKNNLLSLKLLIDFYCGEKIKQL